MLCGDHTGVQLLQTHKRLQFHSASSGPGSWYVGEAQHEGDHGLKWRLQWADANGSPTFEVALLHLAVLLWNWSLVLAVLLGLGWLSARHSTAGEVQEWDQQPRLAALTGLRAALLILIYLHQVDLCHFADVGAFFVLSGFVLHFSRQSHSHSHSHNHSLNLNPSQSPSQSHSGSPAKRPFASLLDWLIFYVARLVRILPSYWVATAACRVEPRLPTSLQEGLLTPFRYAGSLLVSLVVLPFVDPGRSFGLHTEGSYFWFVSTLLVLYALYPLAELALGTPRTIVGQRRAWTMLAAAMAAKLLILTWLSHKIVLPAAPPGVQLYTYVAPVPELPRWILDYYTSPLARLPEFLLGVALSGLSSPVPSTAQGHRQGQRAGLWRWCPGLGDAVLVAMLLLDLLVPQRGTLILLRDCNVFCFGQALLIWSLANQEGSSYVGTLLATRPMVWLGRLAFGIYLLQYPSVSHIVYPFPQQRVPAVSVWPLGASPVHGLELYPLDALIAAAVGLAVTTCIAWVLQLAIEQPCIDLWTRTLRGPKLK